MRGVYQHKDASDGTATPVYNLEVLSGLVDYLGSGQIGATGEDGLQIKGGTVTFENSEVPSVTIRDTEMWGGGLHERNSLGNITHTNDPIVHSGEALVSAGVRLATG